MPKMKTRGRETNSTDVPHMSAGASLPLST